MSHASALAAVLAACFVLAVGRGVGSDGSSTLAAATEASRLLEQGFELHTVHGNAQQASVLYQAAIALNPRNADAHHLLCAALLPTDHSVDTVPPPLALDACREAVALQPGNTNMRNTLGEAFRRSG